MGFDLKKAGEAAKLSLKKAMDKAAANGTPIGDKLVARSLKNFTSHKGVF